MDDSISDEEDPYTDDPASEEEEEEGEEEREEEREEDPELYKKTSWEIAAFEKYNGAKRIFTRDLLKKETEKAKDRMRSLAAGNRVKREYVYFNCLFQTIPDTDMPQRLTIGCIFPLTDYDNQKISLTFLSRVEMHPHFQMLKTCTDSVQYLRALDEDDTLNPLPWIPAPFFLSWMDRDISTDHLDHVSMEKWRSELERLQTIWMSSRSRVPFRKTFRGAHIKRIVCFGLGSLDFSRGQEELQHIAIIDLANMLDREQGNLSAASKVEVWFQDPSYKTKDKILLNGLRDGIRYTEDPEGLLGINEETLVVGVFLPYDFPLMQIVGDMFDEGHGPAGFIVNNIQSEIDRDDPVFNIRNRLSPRTTNMLKGYKGFGQYKGKTQSIELQKILGTQEYWINLVDSFRRNETIS